jgi:hypothetical protein
MVPDSKGRVSMLVHFRPEEAPAAAGWLRTVLRPSGPVAVTWDAGAGNVELANIPSAELPHLREQLYRHGARCVLVRYAHEGRPLLTEERRAAGPTPGSHRLN